MKNDEKEYFKNAFTNIDVNTYVNLFSVLKTPMIPIKDTGVESRVYNHWRAESLLNTKQEDEGKWTKLNLIDYLWLKTIQELRQFGFGLEKIKLVRTVLFAEPNFSVLNKKGNEKGLEEAIEKIEKLDIDAQAKRIAIEHIKKGTLAELLKQGDIHFNLLGAVIYFALITNQDTGLVIYSDGQAYLWVDELSCDKKVEGTFYPPDLFFRPHIYISFTYFLAEFISDKNLEKFIAPYTLLTSQELEILRKVREKGFKEITIKFLQGSGNNDIDIITTKKIGLTKEKHDEICRVLQMGNFQSISLTTQADGKIDFERSHRKKLY